MDDFKLIELEDKEVFGQLFNEDPDSTETSELTFTNLFVWRHRYRTRWHYRRGCALIVLHPAGEEPFGFQPIGPGDKAEALSYLANRLREYCSDARLCRIGETFVEKYVDSERYESVEDRDNSDYVYLTRELIELPGNRFHKKRNHVHRFIKAHQFEYKPLNLDTVACFLEMQEDWCELRDCLEHPELLAEDRAVYEALTNMEELDFKGGAIWVEGRIEAFALGEMLNADTAVIHMEKANPEISGLYAAINQQFCQDAWSTARYVNREQDLGVAGLRKAKLSYHPHHLVRKFIVTPK